MTTAGHQTTATTDDRMARIQLMEDLMRMERDAEDAGQDSRAALIGTLLEDLRNR